MNKILEPTKDTVLKVLVTFEEVSKCLSDTDAKISGWIKKLENGNQDIVLHGRD